MNPPSHTTLLAFIALTCMMQSHAMFQCYPLKNVYKRTYWEQDKSLEELLRRSMYHTDQYHRVEGLLNAGADPNTTDGFRSVLDRAAFFGFEQSALVLLEHGAKANGDDGSSALWHAAYHGQKKLCRELIARGANPNSAEKNGKTALHQTASLGHLNKSSIFLSIRKYNQEECARLLIQAGANLNAQDGKGKTPLFYASEVGNASLCGVLLEMGADLRIRDERGFNPLCIPDELYGDENPDHKNDKIAVVKALISHANFLPHCSAQELKAAQRSTRLALFNLKNLCPNLAPDLKQKILMMDPELRHNALRTPLKLHARSTAYAMHLPVAVLRDLIRFGGYDAAKCIEVVRQHTIEELKKQMSLALRCTYHKPADLHYPLLNPDQLEHNFGEALTANITSRLNPGIITRAYENCSVQ